MNKSELTSNQLGELFEFSKNYSVPDWKFQECHLKQYKDIPKEIKPYYLSSLKITLQTDGYLLFDFSKLLENKLECEIASFITFFINLFGNQIKIFDKLNSVWRKIGVDLNKDPNKSEGIGESPLHMDFVNSEFPPEIVCLFVIRPDSYGGESTLSRISGIEKDLIPSVIATLKKNIFQDGKVEGLSNIGKDINPFPIISINDKWQYRFTANLLKSNDGLAKDALIELYNLLLDKQVSYKVEKNNLLLINQHVMLHGKKPLGPNQELINLQNNRLLMHGFINTIK